MAAPVDFKKDPSAPVGAPVPLFTTYLATGANVTGSRPQYAIAADGRFLMNLAVEDPVAPPIAVVVNWKAGVKK